MKEKEITRYLKKAVLDENFRQLIDSNIESSFVDFNLSDDEKRILRLRNQEMTTLVSTAIHDILEKLVGNKHSVWGEDEAVDYVTTQQSVMIRLITVLPPPPVTITPPPPPPPPTTRPSKLTKSEHLAQNKIDIQSLAEKLKESKEITYENVLDLVTSLSESGYLGSDITKPEESSEIDLYIVGLGIVNVDQITKETEYVLKKSKKVFYVENGIGVDEYLQSNCKNAINLVSEYELNQDRMIAYRAMAAKVIYAAIQDTPITLALYGHPTVFAYPPFLIREICGHLGLKVKVLPGISAFDTICSELMIDPGINGIQMYEATELLMRERPLQNDVPALIWQIGAIETALYSHLPSKPERFEGLKKYLLRFYPENHVVHSIFCSNYFLMPSEIHSFKISEIGEFAHLLHSGHTLYVPPSDYREVVDEYLVEKILDPDHLKSITKNK
jgi:precorrin-6B methylase 1